MGVLVVPESYRKLGDPAADGGPEDASAGVSGRSGRRLPFFIIWSASIS